MEVSTRDTLKTWMHERGFTQAARALDIHEVHKPQKVAYVEPYDSRAKAMKREREIKKMTHQQKSNLINSRH